MHTRHLAKPVPAAAITLLAVALSGNVRAQESSLVPDPLRNPNVMEAIRGIWIQAAGGRHRIESAFRLDRTHTAWRVVPIPPTNEVRKHNALIILGVTFALFHVHTSLAEPEPSPADRAISERYMLRMFTIHSRGLYEYDPSTKKTTQLREGIEWMNSKPQ
jgi:hypothetical protein